MNTNIKPFKEVKAGDTGKDYFGEPVQIHDKGTLKEMNSKYGYKLSGAGLSDFTDLGIGLDAFVVILFQETDFSMFVYGDDGVFVEN